MPQPPTPRPAQLSTGTVTALSEPLEDSAEEPTARCLEFSTTVPETPATAQKAGFWTSTGQVYVTDLHLATSLAGDAEPMLLPDETGSSEEVCVSDASTQPELHPAEEEVGRRSYQRHLKQHPN